MSEPVAIVINTDVLPGADGMYRHDVLSEIRLPNQAELFICPDPRVAELEAVLKIALKQLEEWEVTIDHEFGDGRQLDAIEAAGDLSEATVAVRAALKEMK